MLAFTSDIDFHVDSSTQMQDYCAFSFVSFTRIVLRIKVVDRAGISVKPQLPGLQEIEQCRNQKEKCFIHNNGGNGDCRMEGRVYKGECVTCGRKGPTSTAAKDGQINKIARKPGTKSIYIGESCRSEYQSGLQHIAALKDPKRHKENAIARHVIECHRGHNENVKYEVNIVKGFKRK